MRPRLVIELIATAGCTLGGMHYWSGDSRTQGSEAARHAAEGDRPEGDARVDSRQRAPVARDGFAGDPLVMVDGERVAETAGAAADEARAPDRSNLSAAAMAGTRRVGRQPRAPSSAIAAIPPLAGPNATRPIPELLARAALRLVGLDQAAERTWSLAINQPALAAEARSDLIEDLNDEGFPDPNNYTAADLPLILARLRIIERLAPRAMDDVNAAAFQEAYKDLIDMLIRLRGAAAR